MSAAKQTVITTESGSKYLISADGHQILKLDDKPATARFEANEFAQHISTPKVGRPLAVVWFHGEDRSYCTFTSPVATIQAADGADKA